MQTQAIIPQSYTVMASRPIIKDLCQNLAPVIQIPSELKDAKEPAKQNKELMENPHSGLGMLDLARAQKGIITEKRPRKIQDIISKNLSKTVKEEDSFFVCIDQNAGRDNRRFSNIIVFSALSIVVLFSLNILNLLFYKAPQIKDTVIASAKNGYENLLAAGSLGHQGDIGAADQYFEQAIHDFSTAKNTVNFIGQQHDVFLEKEQNSPSLEHLLKAGQDLAEAGKSFNSGISGLNLVLKEILSAPLTDNARQNSKPSLTDVLKGNIELLEQGHSSLVSASNHLASVKPEVLPGNMRDKFLEGKDQLERISRLSDAFFDNTSALLALLGDRYPHRYLILLQNDTEARPTGGFMGSYLIVDMNDGYLENMSFHDIYDLDGQMQEDIPPPEDIAYVASQWRMRDSNYSPDFPLSAQKTAWFLQKQKGPSVDTVIAVNQSFLGDLLAEIGPIHVEGLQQPLDVDSYQILVSYIVEGKLFNQSSPKEIIPSLVKAFQKKLQTTENSSKILNVILKGLVEKKIMFYSRHEGVQALFDKLSVSGRVLETTPEDDYLDVVVTSVGGNKSDRYINQQLQHATVIGNNGIIQDELTIRRSHTWTPSESEKWDELFAKFELPKASEDLKKILGQGVNKTFIKVYVPKGSQLANVQGIEMEKVLTREDSSLDKTYFFFPLEVAAGDTSTVTLRYTLPLQFSWSPWKPLEQYRLFVQNQPMVHPSFLTKTVIFGDGVKSYGSFPDSLVAKEEESSTLVYRDWLSKDAYFSVLSGK